MKRNISSLQELDHFVFNFLSKLTQKKYAQVILLSGDLGVGKTAFVKSAARFFEVDDEITSPTFVIQKEYDIKRHSFLKKMIHIDAYRLQGPEELEYLGWNELLHNPENIIFIEWPEQIEGIKLYDAQKIKIRIRDKNIRELEF